MSKLWKILQNIGNFAINILVQTQQSQPPREERRRSRRRERWLLTCNCGRHVDQDEVLRKVGGLMELHEIYLSGPKGFIGLCNICNPERGFEPIIFDKESTE